MSEGAVHPGEVWQRLVAVAVLGSERTGDHLPELPEDLRFIGDSAPQDRALDLLRRAAGLSIFEQAGWRPSVVPAADWPPCASEELPECSPRAGTCLARILAGEFKPLLREWCDLAAAAGVRAPVELIPSLLERIQRGAGRSMTAHVSRVIGERGAWVAARNPDWRLCGGADLEAAEEVWEHSVRWNRVGALRRIRSADPERGRALLEQSWTDETPEDREAFVQVLADDLSAKDEPFLESAFEDSRLPVRRAAAKLLQSLPASAYAQRMGDRLREVVSVAEGGGRRGPKLEVSLPEKTDKLWARDGIENRRKHGLGVKAHVLAQVVAGAPLDVWEKMTSASPRDLIGASTRGEWENALLFGWIRAAIAQKHADFATALLDHILKKDRDLPENNWIQELTHCLEPRQRELACLQSLKKKHALSTRLLPIALLGCNHAWSATFSQVFLEALRRHLGTAEGEMNYEFKRKVREHLAPRIDPSLLEQVGRGWRRENSRWNQGDEDTVDALMATMAFRKEMLEELTT